jgi:hypothetical protein
VVIHGHFYQPPREDPWLEVVEREVSAAPAHDWNERIEQECYRAVVAARRHTSEGRIAAIVNTLASISFDFGPTLLAWLERAAPRTYEAVLSADHESARRCGGHGNAVAMPYHHIILPLASRRDKLTEVRWGIADFRRRFRRDPVGMWLPETAVDDDTLDVLAAEGIRFTVLAPHQVDGVPRGGLPGRYRTGGGRHIALFTYDGGISHDVAFGGLLHDARAWAARMVAPDETGARRALVAVATDGETFGHHHRFGEVALAWMLHDLEQRGDVRIENFAAVLDRAPAGPDVRLVEPSSWSCPHGVERWRSDCACRIAPPRDPAAGPLLWRAALRDGLDWLSRELHERFEREGAALFEDPWAVRDGYAGATADPEELARYVAGHARGDRLRAAELLELEWHALQMFTSCGWFFDDIAGIEAQQVLRYAARAIELAGPEAARLETGLLEQLARAQSDTPGMGTGRDVYLAHVKPRIPVPARVAGGHVVARRIAPTADLRYDPGYRVREHDDGVTLVRRRTGREQRFRVRYERTGVAEVAIDVAAVEGGDVMRLGLDDLPEYYRSPVVAAIRAELIARHLNAEERGRLAAGAADVSRLAAAALTRAVAALAHDESPAAVAAVSELADLLALQGLHVPFEAQTTFARVRDAAGPRAATVLEPVGRRLGFATPADAEGA